jgi:CHAD domain-containing protein
LAADRLNYRGWRITIQSAGSFSGGRRTAAWPGSFYLFSLAARTMPRFNKWLNDIEPDDSVHRVARQAIRLRLAAVVCYLKAAGKKSRREEAIHQLRIWTRRSAAALRLFEPLVPRSSGKKMKKRLRQIRAAAGEERDCDVLLERMQAGDADAPRAILRGLRKRRREARADFAALRKRKLRHGKFERQCDKLAGGLAVSKRHSTHALPPFPAWCRAQLALLGEHFFELTSSPLLEDARLHELRIAGKRLRYALELAPAALPARPHRRLYRSLTELQERLGTVCDHLSAIAQLEEWMCSAKSRKDRHLLQSQIAHEREQLERDRQRFIRWWSGARQRRLREAWDAALGED